MTNSNKAVNSKVIKNARRTLRKQYQAYKGLLRAIDKKVPEYAKHAIRCAGLLDAGVVTKAAQHGIHAGVALYHKIRKRQVKP